MNSKPSHPASTLSRPLDLSAAVEAFVAGGGVIAVIPDGDSAQAASGTTAQPQPPAEAELDLQEKLALLKTLAAKGAGVSSLQYSLRMNRREIRQLAVDNGIKINFSKPIKESRSAIDHQAADFDDRMAGHAMHYSSLGYSVPEIAQALGMSIRQVRDLGKAYRLEFRQQPEHDAP